MQNGKVTIQLDRLRSLCFDFNALCAFEEATGQSVLDQKFWTKFEKQPQGKVVRGLLWACLLAEDPELTIEGAGKLINSDLSNLGEVTEKIVKAFQLGMPSKEKKKSDPSSDSLGANSGPLPDTTSA